MNTNKHKQTNMYFEEEKIIDFIIKLFTSLPLYFPLYSNPPPLFSTLFHSPIIPPHFTSFNLLPYFALPPLLFNRLF